MEMSAQQRTALRNAIVASSGWMDYRKAIKKNISEMSKAELLAAAHALNIDLAKITGNDAASSTATESESTMKERTVSPDVTNLARGEFEEFKAHMSERDRTFGEGVLSSIAKADGWATQKQFDALCKIIGEARLRKAAFADTSTATETKPTVAAPSFDKNDAGKPIWDLVKGHALEEVWGSIAPKVEQALSSMSSTKIEMTSNGVVVGETAGHHHPMFSTLCRALSCRAADGFTPNVWIAGPAGSGKTHSVKAFAEAAGQPFYYNGALRDAFELLGYKDANGVYHTTPFREAYEKGGVYLFDEVDGSDNAAVLALNGALANGIASFPDRLINRHPDCRIVSTGNTWGLGATSDYVGRTKIDAAFLDRFGVRLSWGYDVALEQNICGNVDFAKRVQAARVRASAAGLKVLITPRASVTGAALIAGGFTHDEAASMTYLANLTDDQRKIVEGRA